MGKCKTKAIQAHLGVFTHVSVYSDIFRHIKAYPGIIQAYSGIIQTYSKLCVTLTYSYPEA